MKAKTAFGSALIGALLLVFSGCMARPFPPYPNPNLYAQAGSGPAPGYGQAPPYGGGYGNDYASPMMGEEKMMVRLAPLPGATETPFGIVLKEGVLIPLRDLAYDPYQPYQNLPERWFKWCLEYKKTGRYPGWHPCAGGMR